MVPAGFASPATISIMRNFTGGSVRRSMEQDLIEQYAAGGEKLAMAIRGLTVEDMQAFPVPNTWSIQQIVVHLLDSDLILAGRMKRVIAEDNPPLLAFDESLFAAKLHYHDQPAEQAVQVLDLYRKLFANVLRKLPRSDFVRTGNHSERGPLTLLQLLQGAVNHLEHHLKFIHEKRARMGKEMW
jgi:uncharacterized damage-inducible protein DinB